MTARTILAAAGLAAIGLATAAGAQSAAPATDPAGTTATQATPAEGSATAGAAGQGAGAAVATAPDTAGAPAAEAEAAAAPTPAADGLPPDTVAVTFENGRWYNAEGIPTFKIEDGVVDYATFSGYRRYHSECHVCHGPDGEGSTYAPALKNSVMRVVDYWKYQEDVASGIQNVNIAANLVMPAFGTNRNVWCYVDDIYTYLLARGTDALPRGRPANRADKSEEFAALENSCMEG